MSTEKLTISFSTIFASVGAARLLTIPSEIKVEDTIARGGWYMESTSKVFVYIAGIIESVSRAGKALSGWKNTALHIHQPSCIFITEANVTRVENLMIKLFQCSVPQMKRSGRLWPLAHCLLATTLMYLEEMVIEYPTHQMLSVIKRSADECDISMRELLEWGAIIKEKFADDHAVVVQPNNELIPMMFEKMLAMEKTAKINMEVRVTTFCCSFDNAAVSHQRILQMISRLERTVTALYAVVLDSDRAIKELAKCNAGIVSSGSVKKRKPDNEIMPEEVADSAPIEEDKGASLSFSNVFKEPKDPFKATNLGVMDLEEFVYQWYSKNLGTVVLNRDTRIHTWMWCIPPGDKSINDKILDAKSIMKLVEMMASVEEMTLLRCEKPDAAKDNNYEAWEINMKRTSKIVSSLVGDYLLSNDGKVGNAKKMTIRALARRWKNLKYLVPTEIDLR